MHWAEKSSQILLSGEQAWGQPCELGGGVTSISGLILEIILTQ